MLAIVAAATFVQAVVRDSGAKATLFASTDYPLAAIRSGVEGTVAVKFIIETDGLVRQCWITETSGNKLLDDTTSGVLTSRARYSPARDKNGRPIPVTDTVRIIWKLPLTGPELPPDKR